MRWSKFRSQQIREPWHGLPRPSRGAPKTLKLPQARCLLVLLAVPFAASVGSALAGDDAPPAAAGAKTEQANDNLANSEQATAHFEAKIRPVLAQHCYRCHSAAAGKAEGSLRLDTREHIRAGGDRGPAVVPGKPAESLLLTALSHSDPDLQMPPKQQRLSDAVVHDFKAWILAGAIDPREDAAGAPQSPPVTIEAAREHWAYRTPRVSPPPQIADDTWSRRDLDRFVLAKLTASGLAPSPDAPPEALLRRLHFDLVGLPPQPEVVSRFRQQVTSGGLDAAVAAEVDTLLASPRYGERWGRHWLDVARFAESSGKEANISFPYAWRYRDYVIDAFNADVPYDRFLLEQLAGDLLPYENDAERARLLIATGFLALGPKNLDEANQWQFFADIVDEQLDSVTRAIMASSLACARCHDHKFEPYSMEDYYALAGVFASTQTFFGTAVSPANRLGGDPLVLPRGAGHAILHRSIPAARVTQLKTELADLKRRKEEGLAAAKKALENGEDPEQYFTLTEALRIFWTAGGIEGQLEKVDETGQALPLAMGVLDRENIFDAPLLERGEIDRPGKLVPRAVPRVFALDETPGMPSRQSGRLELARWLGHPDHPLTSRVMANRVWTHLFGSGLVRTTDNFGFSGESPSHPELLDYLARRLVSEGWSIKQLVREIATSRTYRQTSAYRPDAFLADPENRLLWRMGKRRLEAEAIRDAMLAVSNELEAQRPVGSLVGREIGDRPISLIGLDPKLPADLDGARHRSVYLPVLRDRLPDVLDLFDFAEPSLVTGTRETTNVPVQALYLMNSPFVRFRSEGFADRLLREASTDEARIRLAFGLCFSREPDAEEERLAAEFLKAAPAAKAANADNHKQRWTRFCQALLCTAEFRNLD